MSAVFLISWFGMAFLHKLTWMSATEVCSGEKKKIATGLQYSQHKLKKGTVLRNLDNLAH